MGKKKGSRSGPHGALAPGRFEEVSKTTRAVQLRRAGHTFDEIAREMGISMRESHRLVEAAFRAMQKYCKEETAQLVHLHTQRLEMMYRALQHKIASGDSRGIEIGLKVLEREAKMLGLDAPEKQQIALTYSEHTDDELIREAERLKIDVKVLSIKDAALPGEDITKVPAALLPHLQAQPPGTEEPAAPLPVDDPAPPAGPPPPQGVPPH